MACFPTGEFFQFVSTTTKGHNLKHPTVTAAIIFASISLQSEAHAQQQTWHCWQSYSATHLCTRFERTSIEHDLCRNPDFVLSASRDQQSATLATNASVMDGTFAAAGNQEVGYLFPHARAGTTSLVVMQYDGKATYYNIGGNGLTAYSFHCKDGTRIQGPPDRTGATR